LIDRGSLLGLGVGSPIDIEEAEGAIRLNKPGVGRMASVSTTEGSVELLPSGGVRIRDRDSGVDLDLIPASEPSHGDDDLDDGAKPVVVWSYPGRTQADAAALFATHAVEMAQRGYRPVAQSWADGRPGAARVLAIGLVAGSLRPNGYLTVTYSLDQPGSDTQREDPIELIRRLGGLRDGGHLTDQEYAQKKAELLERL
jgi:hypothetical protein